MVDGGKRGVPSEPTSGLFGPARPIGGIKGTTRGSRISRSGRWSVMDVFNGYPGLFRNISATGGDEVSDVEIEGVTYRVHQFTSTGSSSFVVDDVGTGDAEAEYLCIAGGGGGPTYFGGGGGAGGLLQDTFTVTARSYGITVGSGGSLRGNGGNSVIADVVTTIGGGAGGQSQEGGSQSGLAGGSGGGGGHGTSTGGPGGGGAGTAGPPRQGFNGGSGAGCCGQPSGGGGGSGGAGGSGNGAPGAGTTINFTGSSVLYARGGGGRGNSTYENTPGSGGRGDPAGLTTGRVGTVIIRYVYEGG